MDDERGGSRARLVIVTGLPGAGKTTLARRLALMLPAAHMCPDEWMLSARIDLWDSSARAVIESTQRSIALDMLRAGRSVVIDFGSWSRDERDALREAARDIGAEVELRYVTAPIDELWQRLDTRSRASRFGPRGIRQEELDAWAAWFEVPTADEFDGYDPPFDAPA